MKNFKRILSMLLAVVLVLSGIPATVFAAHDSTGKPLDLTGDVYLALYIGGSDFPGEPAEYAVSGYLNLNSSFTSSGFTKFAESAEGILEEQILDDVVQGTSGVWGVFSTTGGSHYLRQSSGLVVGEDGNPKKPHNEETERIIIQSAIDNGVFTLPAGDSIEDYTIVWYVIKYQRSDSAWHIDGLITKKSTYSVNYYGNGNSSGAAPTGESGLLPEQTHTVLPNTGNLRKQLGGDTFIFNGWNTASDGTGTHYDAGDIITITDRDVTLYAEWYLQNKYSITVATLLDGTPRNIEDIAGETWTVWAQMEGTEEYLALNKSTTGTYTATVTENGTYYIYFKDSAGTYHEAHGHQVIIYNQNGRTELLNYSVRYELDGGAWADATDDPGVTNHHANTQVIATDKIPVKDNHIFLGWVDQNNNPVNPGAVVTDTILEPTVLTAQWQELVDVTVYVTVDHGDMTDYADKHHVAFDLLKAENGINLPYRSVLLTETEPTFHFDEENNITTYTYVFQGLPQAHYHASTAKSHYDTSITYDEFGSITDQFIHIDLTYAPQSFDLDFDVVVDFTQETRHLLPQAVNVKVSCWDGKDWVIISQQEDTAAPTTVFIDENGKGTGFFPVWKYWPEADGSVPFVYRVEVTSFVLPDGSIVPAQGSEHTTYVSTGTDLYRATVSIEPDGSGKVPTYPATNTTGLHGAYYDPYAANEQNGIPTVTVQIANAYTVTFDAGEGLLNEQSQLVLENQYLYPDLKDYVPASPAEDPFFSGWYDAEGNLAENLSGNYLTQDVTYYARYNQPLTISGTLTIDGTYLQEGKLVSINEEDRAHQVLVVLQKNINGVYNDVGSYLVDFGENYGDLGSGTYRFENLPNDGTAYRIQLRVHNYDSAYDNNGDGIFDKTEYDAIIHGNEAVVDGHLDLVPDTYQQLMEVDPTQIGVGFRPDGALAQVMYRDVGDIHPYQLIAQHETDPYVDIPLINGVGSGSYEVWQYHTEGSLYEYQMNIPLFYGNVDGVFTPEGTAYNSDTSPFIIEFGPASRYSAVAGGQARTLKATLVPKEYDILFDMGIATGKEISGMDQFLQDTQDGSAKYAYNHTWSFSKSFSAYPYLPGYVFEGWQVTKDGVAVEHDGVVIKNGGLITIGAALAEDVVLTAQWTKLEGTAYTIRHLELNTDIPLRGAVTVDAGTPAGTQISAVSSAQNIEGYKYAGAKIAGKLYGLNDDPYMTVSENPEENVLTIYYLPDGSDGYTEQVESNLSLDKIAQLTDDGTYTVRMETFTRDNPITTLIRQNTPMDIVLVLDQSGSIVQNGYLDELQNAIHDFTAHVADHGRINEVDHRIALVGYAGDYDEPPTSTDTSKYPIAGGNTTNWVNTGVFDSNGDFHPYTVTGFTYQEYTGNPTADGTYYALSDNEFLLLTHHDTYYHLIDAEAARLAVLDGQRVYGYAYDENGTGSFVELTRNSSGLWLYGDKQLYSAPEFFTRHEDVWTHRKGLEPRQIHGYGTGSSYHSQDDHGQLYTRTETTADNPQLDIYKDALVPVSVGANGSGGLNPGLDSSSRHIGSNGGTYVQYGIEMANRIFAANPIEDGSDRIRVMIMFTDGLPGIGSFDETVANAAIEEAYIAKNTHNAYCYTVGLYSSAGVDAHTDIAYYMNAVSSNYPNAQSMDDVQAPDTYTPATGGYLGDGTTYYVQSGNNYYELKYGRVYTSGSWIRRNCWYYTVGSTNYRVSTSANPSINNSKVENTTIYTYQPGGYAETPYSGYYSTTDSAILLQEYFDAILKQITTKITQEIILHQDTILRDIMGQGLVLTPGTVITAYRQPGYLDSATNEIVWAGDNANEQVAQVVIPEDPADTLSSPETTTVRYTLDDGTEVVKENIPYISVYNLTAENATDPDKANYHPHAVDITGYNFDEWYVDTDHPGYKMVVTITRIEAKDDVQWGRSTVTNNEQSGLWLPADRNGNRELLLPFDQPTTIFVERAYVLDYGKPFTLEGWYFDSQDGKVAEAIHVDCNTEDGMNWFDPENPNTANSVTGEYGNTQYGNVSVENGKVVYTPTSMNWGGMDQFYVFGDTWRKTVLAQSANENGNLWNKVTVIPANNVYYEDTFVTTPDSDTNGFTGFTFTGNWLQSQDGGNTEIPEHQEQPPYGDVHGWTDALVDEKTFTDGTAASTGTNTDGKPTMAMVQFTFTGTGVDVYTRTNANSGMILAMLYSYNDAGKQVLESSQIIDNLAASGDYYQIPTLTYDHLAYGTYTVKIIANGVAISGTDKTRCEYYLDGIRVYNPLGSDLRHADQRIKEAYDLELNAVFTEIRQILLDYGSFTGGIGSGAVFLDQLKDGQGEEGEEPGTSLITYSLGSFEAYGPKNEVYLASGQSIVLKVDPANTYYMGMKCLKGNSVIANVSGIDDPSPTQIQLSHTTDLYYEVTPINGFIVIQNGSEDGSVLSLTRLRTTNLDAPAKDGGVLPITVGDAVQTMAVFDQQLAAPPATPEETLTPAQQHALQLQQLAQQLFGAVRSWLGQKEETE